jgi:hypothetical protein
MNNFGITQQHASPPWVGIAKVCIPFNVNREDYIKNCYHHNTVSLLMPSGTMASDCIVDKKTIQEIKFPDTYKKLGSRVVFVTERDFQSPIVIAVIDSLVDRDSMSEGSFHVSRRLNKGMIDIVGTGDGQLYINLNSETPVLKINVTGGEGLIDVKCNGAVNVESTGSININSSSDVRINKLDEKGTKSIYLKIDETGLKYQDDNNTFFINKEEGKIIHDEGSEALLLGDTTQTEIEKLKNYVDTMKTALDTALGLINSTISGVSAPFTATMSAVTSGDFSKIKSTKSFIS